MFYNTCHKVYQKENNNEIVSLEWEDEEFPRDTMIYMRYFEGPSMEFTYDWLKGLRDRINEAFALIEKEE